METEALVAAIKDCDRKEYFLKEFTSRVKGSNLDMVKNVFDSLPNDLKEDPVFMLKIVQLDKRVLRYTKLLSNTEFVRMLINPAKRVFDAMNFVNCPYQKTAPLCLLPIDSLIEKNPDVVVEFLMDDFRQILKFSLEEIKSLLAVLEKNKNDPYFPHNHLIINALEVFESIKTQMSMICNDHEMSEDGARKFIELNLQREKLVKDTADLLQQHKLEIQEIEDTITHLTPESRKKKMSLPENHGIKKQNKSI